jgi:hypothetical protein
MGSRELMERLRLRLSLRCYLAPNEPRQPTGAASTVFRGRRLIPRPRRLNLAFGDGGVFLALRSCRSTAAISCLHGLPGGSDAFRKLDLSIRERYRGVGPTTRLVLPRAPVGRDDRIFRGSLLCDHSPESTASAAEPGTTSRQGCIGGVKRRTR